MASAYSKLVSLSAAVLLVFSAAAACSKEKAPKAGPTSAAGTTSEAAATTTTTPAGKPETVVFEVTGTGSALTIDLVPSGPERLYDVPLPWTRTITITPDVRQLQVVVIGKADPGPGCKITLDGKVVAEQPVGGDAHCVFDR